QSMASRHAPAWIRALVLAADGYLVEPVPAPTRREPGLVPGSASTTDRTRDTLVALPGLTLATGRPERAREVLEHLGERLHDGLLPADAGAEAGAPGSADATMWYVQALRAYFEHTIDTGFLA